jgi:hypothetical protein
MSGPIVCPKNYGRCGVAIQYDPNKLFILMPFSEKVAPQSLFDLLQELQHWNVVRADSDLSKPEIWCKICANIQESRAVIADLSGLNPNVFLELGLTWGLGKPFVLLTQSTESLPFDTRSFHVIKYERSGSSIKNDKRVKNDVVRALKELPSPAFISSDTTPEGYLASRIREAKARTTRFWRIVKGAWRVIDVNRAVFKIGVCLLKAHPMPKTASEISNQTGVSINTIHTYTTSQTHAHADYFGRSPDGIEFTDEGIYWMLDEVVPNL